MLLWRFSVLQFICAKAKGLEKDHPPKWVHGKNGKTKIKYLKYE